MDRTHILVTLGDYKTPIAVVVLAGLWAFETWFPYYREGRDRRTRLRHAGRNLALTLLNTVAIGLAFASATAFVVRWADARSFGLLRQWEMSFVTRTALALLLMDAWMYVWHRMNHVIPLLWRFHRMHHSDSLMDVTSATRFHPGEIALSSLLRLAVVPLLGLDLWHLLLYESILLPVIQFQHSNVRLPALLDRLYRAFFVSPNMHRVHHSRYQPETDSNYSSVFSWWDRLAGTFRLRDDPQTIELGLDGFDDRRWQTFAGLLRTPFQEVEPHSAAGRRADPIRDTLPVERERNAP